MHDGPRAMKDGSGGLERRSEDGPWTASTWTCQQASVHARMEVKMVLTEVKMVIGPSQGECVST